MTASSRLPLRWLDGLRGRITAALLMALAVQFVGSDIIFERIEAANVERGRAQRLADWLAFANEFANTRPDATDRMTWLWQPDLIVERRESPPVLPAAQMEDKRVEQLVAVARPHLAEFDFRAVREGDDIIGSIRLSNGGWLAFRSKDYYVMRSQLPRYVASGLLLLVCVVIIVLLFGRMIGRPLARIAQAAGQVGHDEVIPVVIEGPREVRQVATAFERMQTRLVAQLRDRLQSMAAMSHDLRTPLARMRLNASTVEDHDTRAALEQDVEEMEGFVSSVLEYLRGDEPEPEQWVDIASIVMTVVDEVRDQGEDVEYSGPDRLETSTRPLKLKRVVRNIIQNAVRHAGNANVTLDRSGNDLRITVEDDGPGIPPDLMDVVFEPFHRIETSRNRGTGGSGLGLAIARRLVARLGGTITLINRSSGGLRTVILLPEQ